MIGLGVLLRLWRTFNIVIIIVVVVIVIVIMIIIDSTTMIVIINFITIESWLGVLFLSW